jgi:hypothetical protein
MLYPAGYALWVILRGLVIGRWPYPFVSVPELGWGQVALNMVWMALVFLSAFLIAIALGRLLHARRQGWRVAGR